MKNVLIIIFTAGSLFASAQQPISNKGNRLQTYPSITAVNPEVEALVEQVSMQNLENSIRWMQQFIRNAQSPAALETQNWLIEQFESFGLDVYVHYFPCVDFDGICDKPGDTLDAGNVVAIQWGTEFPDEYIVVSSHYDHPDGPGADDNASGTAGVVEIARILSQHSFKRSIMYVPFNAEELGVVGSFHYAEKCALEDMNILGVFNMDMIGFFPENVGPLTMYSGSSKISDRLWEYYQTVANLYVTDIPTYRLHYGDIVGSDHITFNIYEYPALYIGDIEYWGKHPCYHRPCDTLGTGVNSLPLAQGFIKATLAATVELADGWLPPQNLSAIPADSKITVSWDVAPETSTYKLFKNNVLLTETAETSYIDTDVVNGTEYIYYVKGIHSGSGEESPESNRDSIAPSLPLILPYFNDFEESINGWRTNFGWTQTTSQHYSGKASFTSGNILQNHFSTAELCWFSIPDTAANVLLSFYFRGGISINTWKESNGFIEISTDRKRWDKLIKISGNFQNWSLCQIPLNQYIGAPFVQMRIRVESAGAEGDYVVGRLFFDDVNVNFTCPTNLTPENLQITSYSEYLTTAKLEWGDIPAAGYNIYRNNIKINNRLVKKNNYSDNSASPNDCYRVTAFYLPEVESDFSNEACIKDVGIKETIPFSNIQIIPNPSTGKINIETGLSIAYHLAIYNLQGIKVFDKELFTDGMLDISRLPKGMYILKIATRDDSVAKKIVIK